MDEIFLFNEKAVGHLQADGAPLTMGLYSLFKKVATSLVGLLFIERMLNLSHVKQVYSQPIHLTYELSINHKRKGIF